MHFFYLDESGDTGTNLNDTNQPVEVVGGINLRDEGWNKTQTGLAKLLQTYFGSPPALGFELHATELLSPHGDGPFAGHPMAQRQQLVKDILDFIVDRKHGVHLFAMDKSKVASRTCGYALPYSTSTPYLVAFDYLVTYINWYVKENLGSTARAMLIFDRKDQFHDSIETIMHERRFAGTQAHRIKWIVEFSYSVDSKKNAMIQLSDIVLYCAKRFLELENGYRQNWTANTVQFYAECYNKIVGRIARASLVERQGRNTPPLNNYLKAIQCKPRTQWRRHHGL